MEKLHPIQFIDLSFQVGLVNSKKKQPFEEYTGNPDNALIEARLMTIFSEVENWKWLRMEIN